MATEVMKLGTRQMASGWMLSVSLLAGLAWAALLTGCAEPQLSEPPAPAETRDGRWQQDVSYVCDNIARLHKDAFRFASQSEYEAARDALLRDIPELSDAQITVRLASIVAQLQDAHTSLPIYGPNFPALPFQLGWTSDGFCLGAAPTEHARLLESKLVAIGNTPIEAAVQTIGEVVSHENEHGIASQLPDLVRLPAVMHDLGLSEKPDRVTLQFETEAGTESVEFVLADEEPEIVAIERTGVPLSDTNTSQKYWYRELPEENALYVAYNACSEDEQRPFKEFAEEILEILSKPDIERLVFDLRRNRGGSQLVAWPLLKKLPGHRLDRPGGIIALVGPRTFSSGKGNALDLRDWTNAILMGRPLGQRPNSFGEIKQFRSPNYELAASYSTKYFVRGSEEDDAVLPDIEVPLKLEDWKNGRDLTLERALAYDPNEEQ